MDSYNNNSNKCNNFDKISRHAIRIYYVAPSVDLLDIPDCLST